MPKDNGDNSTAIVSKRKQIGSVVFTTATLCFVHLDGEFAPIPIPIEHCSHYDEDIDEVSGEDGGDAPAEHQWQEVVSDSDNEAEVEEEDTSEDDMTEPVADRPRTVEEALKSGGWKLVRSKKHLMYSRCARISSDDKGFEQNVVLAKTPSDRRANLNALALFRRLDEAMNEVVGPSTTGDSSGKVIACSICNVQKDVCEFSKTQAKKSKAKCLDCVAKAEASRVR